MFEINLLKNVWKNVMTHKNPFSSITAEINKRLKIVGQQFLSLHNAWWMWKFEAKLPDYDQVIRHNEF